MCCYDKKFSGLINNHGSNIGFVYDSDNINEVISAG